MNAVKFIFCLVLVVLSGRSLAVQAPPEAPKAATDVPKGYEVDRYKILWTKSPFSLSSAPDAEGAGGFAQDMILGGIAKIGETEMITIVDKKNAGRRLTLSPTSQPEGISLVSIQMDKDLKKATATIRKGGETATIKYDMDFLQASSPAMASAPPVPAAQPNPNNNANNLPRVQNPNRGANRGGPPRVIPRRIVIPNAPQNPPVQQ